jgi:competence protein ComEC
MILVYCAFAWLAGIVLAKAPGIPWQVVPLCLGAAVLALRLWPDQRSARLGAACLTVFSLGVGRYSLAVPRFNEHSLATYNGTRWATVEGLVVDAPDERENHTNLRLRAESLILPDGAVVDVDGLVLVRADRYPEWRVGDRLSVEGPLEDPPAFEGFSYSDYLARRSIYSWIPRARVTLLLRDQGFWFARGLLMMRRRAQSTIAAILPEPQGALLTGILLGVESGIPDDLVRAFEESGTMHIVAISGFNIALLAGAVMRVVRRNLDRRKAVWATLAGIGLYAVFVGAPAPVVRAALMAILCLWARELGRRAYGPASLAAAAIGMTAWNPHLIWDTGFQLSYLATAGLVIFAEPLRKCSERFLPVGAGSKRAPEMVASVADSLTSTLAAVLATAPVLLGAFGSLSAAVLISNVMILPAQPYVMSLGALVTAAGILARPLGQAVGWTVWPFLTYTIEVARLTANVPAFSVVQVQGWMVTAYYAVLIGFAYFLMQPRDVRLASWHRIRDAVFSRLDRSRALAVCVLLAVLGLVAWRALPDGQLHVVFLDVGEGDAIFIQTPSGRQILIDGGPSGRDLLARLGAQMPFWDRTLDVVVLTHPDLDHVTGLIPVLERFRVGRIIHREMEPTTSGYRAWLELVEVEGAQVLKAERGLELHLDEGLSAEVVHPGDELLKGTGADGNNNSVVARLTYGSVRILLSGDIEAPAEAMLVTNGSRLKSTLLKVPHHGGCSSTTQAFLEAVDPDVAVISVGKDNTFGHPCPDVLLRLAGIPVYRTDRDGTVEIVTDGKNIWARTGQ